MKHFDMYRRGIYVYTNVATCKESAKMLACRDYGECPCKWEAREDKQVKEMVK